LSQSRAGFLDYFDGYLGKSSVFAAFASHRLVPLLLAPNSSEADGLVSQRHFLFAPVRDELRLDTQQQIADAALEWYTPHRLNRMASAIGRTLNVPFPLEQSPAAAAL
jgi:hypothetical protein